MQLANHHMDVIKKVFQVDDDQKDQTELGMRDDGVYTLKMFLEGQPRDVVVDDCIPWNDGYQFYQLSGQNSDEMWLPILEKALAKVYGSYMRLENGTIGELFSTLTGCPSLTIYHDTDSQKLKELLMKNNYPLIACQQSSKNQLYKLPHNSYLVKDYKVRNDQISFHISNPFDSKNFQDSLTFSDYIKSFDSTVINFHSVGQNYSLVYGEEYHKLGNEEYCLFRFKVRQQMGKDVDEEKAGRKPRITDDDEPEFISNLISNQIGKNLEKKFKEKNQNEDFCVLSVN